MSREHGKNGHGDSSRFSPTFRPLTAFIQWIPTWGPGQETWRRGKTVKKILCLSAIVSLVMSFQTRGDTLVTRTKEYKGTFEGYEKNTFAFRTTGGEMLKEDRSQVTQLDLDKPCKVAVLLAREKEAEKTLFVEYKTLKFVFQDGKKDKTVFANHVKEISVDRPPPEGGGGGVPGQGDVVIPPLNIAAVEDNPDLTVAQSAVIARYGRHKAAEYGQRLVLWRGGEGKETQIGLPAQLCHAAEQRLDVRGTFLFRLFLRRLPEFIATQHFLQVGRCLATLRTVRLVNDHRTVPRG